MRCQLMREAKPCQDFVLENHTLASALAFLARGVGYFKLLSLLSCFAPPIA